ncbi:hypothetical protein BT96DRAFT_858116, partial [Gymnopus androsaceus JB14]
MPSGSSPTPKKFVFKEPSKQLRRGKACLNCRFHKIKCNGVRPICGSCTRRDEECEYTGEPSRMKELEQRVTRLKARVRELESPERTGSAVDSYFTTDAEGLFSVPGPPTRSNSDHSSTSRSTSYDPLLGFPEPSISIITMLLNNFLPSAAQFGFFLHIERFKSAALLKAPFGDTSRPSAALLNTIYLWGAHLSPVDALRSNESVFLNRALQQVSVEIPSAIHSTAQIMHTIQAEVLLSTYFFRKNQLLEAEFHLNGAVSLSQSAGLHHIRSDRVFSSPVVSVLMETEIYLPPPQDVIEEGERINGFWAVFCLHRLLSITLGNSSNCFARLDNPCVEVDTPWPCEYEFGLYDDGMFGHSTIDQFIRDLGSHAQTEPAFDLSSYAKAVVLLYFVTGMTDKFKRGLDSDAYTTFQNDCVWFEGLITRFHASLAPSDGSLVKSSFLPSSPGHSFVHPSSSNPVLTHLLVSCAYMQVQKILASCGVADALQRCISTARCIIDTLSGMNQLGSPHLHPISGTLCAMACSVFGDELAGMEVLGDWDLNDLG